MDARVKPAHDGSRKATAGIICWLATSFVAGDTIAWRFMRVERALKIGVQLRLVDAPERCDRLDRAILRPVAAQIGDWPAHAIHDLDARRMDRASLSTGGQSGAHRGNQTIAQMAGAREKAVYGR